MASAAVVVIAVAVTIVVVASVIAVITIVAVITAVLVVIAAVVVVIVVAVVVITAVVIITAVVVVLAAYLQRAGLNVLVLERRHVIGGAAVTEEIIPGFKFSRCSYVLSLLRPQIMKDLKLKDFGLKLHFRDPNYFTPLADGRFLLLGSDEEKNYKEISKFSKPDAKARIDPPIIPDWDLLRKLGADLPLFYDLLTAPATKISILREEANKWFESEPLKACLAMDSIIGATVSPSTPGSAYVLLHHVMGELEGRKSAWAYVEGGMGKLSQAIADSATSMGTTVLTNKPVKSFLLQGESKTAVSGVVLEDGTEIKANIVLSNATPKITFLDLLPEGVLSEELHKDISCFSYDSPVTKINVAVDKLPNFLARPNKESGEASDHHRCTIHINTESMATIEKAYTDCLQGRPSDRPLIEMCIPSSLDPTLAPPGCHVLSLFIQYTPYHLKDGTWTDEKRNAYADKALLLSLQSANCVIAVIRLIWTGFIICAHSDLVKTERRSLNIGRMASTVTQLFLFALSIALSQATNEIYSGDELTPSPTLSSTEISRNLSKSLTQLALAVARSAYLPTDRFSRNGTIMENPSHFGKSWVLGLYAGVAPSRIRWNKERCAINNVLLGNRKEECFLCFGDCPSGYRNDGLTCFRDARLRAANNAACPWYDKCGLTFSRGCSKCPAGYKNDGCVCRRNPHVTVRPRYHRGVGIVMKSYGRGVGVLPNFLRYDPTSEREACRTRDWNGTAFVNKDTEVVKFVNHRQKIVVFGFRGTEVKSASDWLANLDFRPEEFWVNNTRLRAHRGFKNRYDNIASWFEKEYLSIPREYLILLTGHNQGAAQASIASVFAAGKLARPPNAVITWGSPLTGAWSFRKFYRKYVGCHVTVNYITKGDIVASLPMIHGYAHACDVVELEPKHDDFIRAHSLYSGYGEGLELAYGDTQGMKSGCDVPMTTEKGVSENDVSENVFGYY
ncbi:pyridine nucleotide-disulfide oxidoreductase domain-containing 2 [Paramuricea clavata]|uniref:Pyridine nucleotide-disulfide oxidoreductase domain-containing protein 2 n=1 Tax=Paramuricea clavata TaxID=317549 RepID=A0A7D9D596_PARCT|nr:pyridine nucleotide-disulfide oxidoreductase domain-containing 2 [Paramuricea clavata]